MIAAELSTAYPWLAAGGIVAALVGGVAVLLKLRPESGQITVMAAQGAVIAQTGVIDTLRQEMARMNERVTALESERVRLVTEADRLRMENMSLRERVLHLEEELAVLRRHVGETNGGDRS